MTLVDWVILEQVFSRRNVSSFILEIAFAKAKQFEESCDNSVIPPDRMHIYAYINGFLEAMKTEPFKAG